MLISTTTALGLHVLSPAELRTPLVTAGQVLVAIGISLLLTDLCLYPIHVIPFTHLNTSSITDFPLMVVRYFVLFPFFVFIVVHQERWIEASLVHLLVTAAIITIAHLFFLKAHHRALRQSTLQTPPEESDEILQRLGLCDH
jgi:glucan phosphoethanolaminetransferase (alkaline phosphatase superfamily)